MDLTPRGPLTAALLPALDAPLHPIPDLPVVAAAAVQRATAAPGTAAHDTALDTVVDEDVQLALYLLYELHYGLDGADPRWEWAPDLLAARAVLETAFEADLRRRWAVPVPDEPVASTLFDMTADAARPGRGSLAAHVARYATYEQVQELLVLRSVYQLKEADPHTWGIPRLRGRAKAALVDIQSDEYGGGDAERMHAVLFATTMRSLGLDDTRNAYLEAVPAGVLAGVNAISLFGLHGRLVAALCGHLAAFEMTSSLPARRWVTGLRRLGVPEEGVVFYDEHVEADAVHEQVAAHDLCGSLVEEDPRAHADVLFGAAVCLGADDLVGSAVRGAWSEGRSPLRTRLAPATA
ncbi:iron-containing redox enzyme family protein [Aquipuribacter nitratireducens]|uniref:Iron-containing redox enzyme family protein n=1 Tax=Aquipuribacter nitratireducens TaxID=650104 RepID=A0ABW0GK05_9MICO